MDEGNLTNQQISKKFVNQFDLVNYAIRLAENMIRTGRAPRVKVDVDNPVVQVLAEILEGKDKFEEIIVEEIIKEEVALREARVFSVNNKDKNKASSFKSGEFKSVEKKKSQMAY